jgi:hypothetical protein
MRDVLAGNRCSGQRQLYGRSSNVNHFDARMLWEELARVSLDLRRSSVSVGAFSCEKAESHSRQLQENGEVDRDVVVLHYSGYGYDQDGVPDWLADAVECRPVAVRMITYFHELYANSKPWRRAFWYSCQQRSVARRIALASDVVITNCYSNAVWLEGVLGCERRRVRWMPVFSNIGELPVVLPREHRRARGVLFGAWQFKRPFLGGRAALRTARTCRKWGITQLVDVGVIGPVNRDLFLAHGVALEQTGYLSAEEISGLMAQSQLGFVEYPRAVAEKSTVLAAMAAHGLGIVRANPRLEYPFQSKALNEDDASFEECGLSALRWYRDHSLEAHARMFLSALAAS